MLDAWHGYKIRTRHSNLFSQIWLLLGNTKWYRGKSSGVHRFRTEPDRTRLILVKGPKSVSLKGLRSQFRLELNRRPNLCEMKDQEWDGTFYVWSGLVRFGRVRVRTESCRVLEKRTFTHKSTSYERNITSIHKQVNLKYICSQINAIK